jgi:hypothetical protein
MQLDAWYWRQARSNPTRGVSDGSDGARPLWRSRSAQTEMFFAGDIQSWLVIAPGLSNLPGVRVGIGTLVLHGSGPVRTPNLLPYGGRNPEMCPSTCRFSPVWLDPSGLSSSCAFWVVPYMVTLRYPTVNHKILKMACHCFFWMDWQLWWSRNRETRFLPHTGNKGQWRVHHLWSSIMGNLSGDWLQTGKNKVLAPCLAKEKRKRHTPSPMSKWMSMEYQPCKVLHCEQSRWHLIADLYYG